MWAVSLCCKLNVGKKTISLGSHVLFTVCRLLNTQNLLTDCCVTDKAQQINIRALSKFRVNQKAHTNFRSLQEHATPRLSSRSRINHSTGENPPKNRRVLRFNSNYAQGWIWFLSVLFFKIWSFLWSFPLPPLLCFPSERSRPPRDINSRMNLNGAQLEY